MRDVRFGLDPLLSLRFNGPGLTVFYVVALMSGNRVGLHCIRSRRPCVLSSSAIGSIPVITGDRFMFGWSVLTLILLRYHHLQPLLPASRSGLIIVPQIA